MGHRPTSHPAGTAGHRRRGVADLWRRSSIRAPVLTETETETTIEVPAPFSPDPSFGGPSPFGGQPPFPGGPPRPPPMVKKVVKRIDLATIDGIGTDAHAGT